MGLCGACTVHIDGQAQRSCSTPVSSRMSPGKRSPQLKDCLLQGTIPSSRRGSTSMFRNVDTASLDKS
jgi:hypothetical protein